MAKKNNSLLNVGGEHLSVSEVLFENKKYVIIGEPPAYWENGQKPYFFTHSKYSIVAAGRNTSHAYSAHHINEYLKEIAIDELELDYWGTKGSRAYIQSRGIRLMQSGGEIVLDEYNETEETDEFLRLLEAHNITLANLQIDESRFLSVAIHDQVVPPPR